MTLFGTIRAPRELIFGRGQRAALGEIAVKLGQRAVVVTDERLANDAAFCEMMDQLGAMGMDVHIDSSTQPDVPVDNAIQSAISARDFAPDLVIGIGGGSCLDLAKCVAILLTHGGRPQDYYGEHMVPGPVLPLIAIPTTSGTGSEVTPVSVLSDSERSLKVGISSPHIIPTVSICDPDLTLTCPTELTAIAGADAMTHAIEALTAMRAEPVAGIAQKRVFVGKNAMSDHFALEAIGLLWGGLEAACTNGSDIVAREKVMMGATLAGLAFGVAGTAAAHAIQYPVGALTHTAHGAGVACVMPYVMQWNAPQIADDLEKIAHATGLRTAADVIPAIAALFERIGIPVTLDALGLKEDKLDWVAEQSCGISRLIQNNPRPLDATNMRRLIGAAFTGDRACLK